MAERERLTKRERRERGREERRQKAEEALKRRRRGQFKAGLATFVVVGVVAAVVLQAFLGGPPTLDAAILVSTSDASEARTAAGCEVLVERQPLPDRRHLPTGATHDADALFGDIRPTHSGPHTEGVYPVLSAASRPIDEVVSTHNLEHGTIIVWWDPDQVDSRTAGSIGDWAELLNANGFRRDVGGIGIITSPYEDPGISSGKAVAFRAWGTAMDCDRWDETAANAFVIEHFGSHGIGPERLSAPYPTDVLAFSDREVDDTSTDEAPLGERMTDDEIEVVDPDELDPDPAEDTAEDTAEDAG